MPLERSRLGREPRLDGTHAARTLTAGYTAPVRASGWTKEETIESLVRKSGYKAAITPELKGRISLTRRAVRV